MSPSFLPKLLKRSIGVNEILKTTNKAAFMQRFFETGFIRIEFFFFCSKLGTYLGLYIRVKKNLYRARSITIFFNRGFQFYPFCFFHLFIIFVLLVARLVTILMFFVLYFSFVILRFISAAQIVFFFFLSFFRIPVYYFVVFF